MTSPARPLPLLSLILALGACSPPASPAAMPIAPLEPMVISTRQSADPHAAGTSKDSTAVIDRSVCGMPDKIREVDWPRILSPTEYRPPHPPAAGAFTLAVLPDTQYYASCREKHLGIQADWLAENYDAQRVLATMQLGDLTEHNTHEEWIFVRDALKPVAEKGPLFVASGNHDYGEDGTSNYRHTLFADYFGTPPAKTASLVAEKMTPGDVENAYYRLPIAGITLGVLILEWSPRTTTVDWARQAMKKYPTDKKIFITHAYLYYDGTRYDWATHGDAQKWNPRAYGTAHLDPRKPGDAAAEGAPNNWAPEGAYDGEMLWNEFLVDMPGLFLTLSGHVLGDGSGVLTSRGKSGNDVHQVLTNFQMLDEGGLGYLRLIEFDQGGRTMKMKTYSPSLKLSATGSDQEFELKMHPPLFE